MHHTNQHTACDKTGCEDGLQSLDHVIAYIMDIKLMYLIVLYCDYCYSFFSLSSVVMTNSISPEVYVQ